MFVRKKGYEVLEFFHNIISHDLDSSFMTRDVLKIFLFKFFYLNFCFKFFLAAGLKPVDKQKFTNHKKYSEAIN